MRTAKSLTMTAADELAYQNTLVRTGQSEYIGSIVSIAIGDDADYKRPMGDPLIDRWGRLMQFGNLSLPLAQSLDHSTLLVPGHLHRPGDGAVDLPDWPDPNWKPVKFPDQAPHIRQSLEDRVSGLLESNTNFLVFQPVLYVIVRPELDGHILSTFWKIICGPRGSDGRNTTLLIDRVTGETHFFGGRYEIVATE